MRATRHRTSLLSPTVLCIDGDPDVSQAIQCCLELYGVRVERAYDVQQACRISTELKPDLVISDLVLPGMGRHGVLAQLRSHPGTGQVPIVILTGQSSPAIRQRALLTGASAFLTKPLGLDELLRALREWIAIPSRPLLCRPAAADN